MVANFSFIVSIIKAVVRFSVSPKRTEYVQEGQTVSLKWEYTIEASDKLIGIVWTSYDPPGSTSEFRLAVKPAGGSVVYLPNKPKGESLYQGRINIKDQATLEITNVTLDNFYRCAVVYQDSVGLDKSTLSEAVKVTASGRYYFTHH